MSKKIKDGPFTNKLSFKTDFPEHDENGPTGDTFTIDYYEEGHYKDGLLDGSYRKYIIGEDGSENIIERGFYSKGKLHGYYVKFMSLNSFFWSYNNDWIEETFYEHGEIIRTKKHDPDNLWYLYSFYEGGKIFESKSIECDVIGYDDYDEEKIYSNTEELTEMEKKFYDIKNEER